MSEENKNRGKDKGKQRNVIKYDTTSKREPEFAKDSEFVTIEGKKNKRKR